MKQKLILALCIAFSCNSMFSVTPEKIAKKDLSLISKIFKAISFPVAPSEVSHGFDLTRSNNDDPYTLDTDRITQLQKMYEQNFKLRTHISRATYLAMSGSLLWLGYKLGYFDWMLPGKVASTTTLGEQLPIPKLADYAGNVTGYDAAMEVYHKSNSARIAAIEASKDIQNGNWLINGISNVGWTGITIAGSLIVQSKWSSFFIYALSEPSFKWFLNNHSIISIIDRLKRSAQALSSPNMQAEFSTEYHSKLLIPSVEALIRNTEQFIAFIDYYLPILEEDVVTKEAMNDISRYLFNITNDFLQKINPLLKDPASQSHASLLPIIDEYRADMVTFNNRCKVFEEEFFPGS